MAGNSILIAAGTGAATADFKLNAGQVAQLTGFGFGGVNGDTIRVLTSYDGGTNYERSFDGSGTEILIGGAGAVSPRNPVLVEGPGFFRVERVASTTDSVGVAVTVSTIL